MKHYSDYTKEYVQDICNALNSEGITEKYKGRPFHFENFKNLTDFLQGHVVGDSNVYYCLVEKGLVNRGKCPYTGEQIGRKSPNWSYQNRTINVSQRGLEIMQREANENLRELFKDDKDFVERIISAKENEISRNQELSKNKGCLGVLIILIVSVSLLGMGIYQML